MSIYILPLIIFFLFVAMVVGAVATIITQIVLKK
jgi:hypothetical protein